VAIESLISPAADSPSCSHVQNLWGMWQRLPPRRSPLASCLQPRDVSSIVFAVGRALCETWLVLFSPMLQ